MVQYATLHLRKVYGNWEGHANIQYYLQGTISYSYSLHKYK